MTTRPAAAEFVGTFFFVVAAAGAAVVPTAGGSSLAVAAAAGLALVAIIASLGHVSGGHFNPAVTIGLIAAGRFEAARAPLYLVAQVAGGAAAAVVLAAVADGIAGPAGDGHPTIANHYAGVGAAFVIEAVATALLMIVVVGATARKASPGFAGLAVGLALAALYVVAGPITGASLNPARSTAGALVGGTRALAQLWLFWLAPILGGVIGGLAGRYLQDE